MVMNLPVSCFNFGWRGFLSVELAGCQFVIRSPSQRPACFYEFIELCPHMAMNLRGVLHTQSWH